MSLITGKGTNLLTLIVLTLLLLSSCIPTKMNSSRKVISDNTETPTTTEYADPTFEITTAYFQIGTATKQTQLVLDTQYAGTFYLKGQETHRYIRYSNTNQAICMLVDFPASIEHKILSVALVPRNITDTTNLTKEYYYLGYPNNTSQNSTFCDTPQVRDFIDNEIYASTSVATGHDLATFCPSCTSSLLLSAKIYFVDVTGSQVEGLINSYLNMQIQSTPGTDSTGGVTCSTSDFCRAQNYDCCNQGQCVTAGILKPNASSQSEYQTAILDVAQNPLSYQKYPNIYYTCAVEPVVTPVPTPTTSPEEIALKQFQERKELYDCTTPSIGEMAVCTRTYSDISANSSTFVYETYDDDRNFSYIYSGSQAGYQETATTITEIVHSGITIWKDGAYTVSSASLNLEGGNDSISLLSTSKAKNVTYNPGSIATSDELKIRYKIDGSCEYINDSLAKCTKYYIQGQNLGYVTDHFPNSKKFIIPQYADTNKIMTVKVNTDTKQKGIDWNITTATKKYVEFTETIYDGQSVTITYYVNTNAATAVLKSKKEALDKIDQMCLCGGLGCTLTTITDDDDNITAYKCKYPNGEIEGDVPIHQEILMTAKTVPLRFYDKGEGVYYENPTSDIEAEGTKFEYTSADKLKPNNETTYIGFNEILGSFDHKADSARPAKQVSVTKGKPYTIYVNSGVFSSCQNCGTDYYDHIQKLFPSALGQIGAGFKPEATGSNPDKSSTYRKDDLLFGRACFIPPTMIPWTHRPNTNLQTQRLDRQRAQHFLFANGYQRDWYGFDYGAIIGSFDGIKWFAIGTERRVVAETNKLFLAVNAYFGDLTEDNTFFITVDDATFVPNSGSTVTTDYSNDGAECQKYHVCDADSDCIAQLGWDYTCQSIGQMQTYWPSFDSSANELPGSGDQRVSLLSLFNSIEGGTKRCVYRGQGTPCRKDYNISSTSQSYNNTTTYGLHACTPNSYCQAFSDGGFVAKFNDSISRIGRSVKTYNTTMSKTEHEFGLASPSIGRPRNYNGKETMPTEANANFSYNNYSAICIPGKNADLSSGTFVDLNKSTPSTSLNGDMVGNIGMTKTTTGIDPAYLSACGILDDSGNYLYTKSSYYNKQLNDATEVVKRAGQQAMSTNALKLLETLSSEDIIKNFSAEQITDPTLQENRCLRAPGSVCFSNYDCAPSKLVTTYLSDLSESSLLNVFEINFWKEELICSQKAAPTSTDYALKNNKCCRENGKDLTIATYRSDLASTGSAIEQFDNSNLPGIGISYSDKKRYSRYAPVWKDYGSTTMPKLETAAADACPSSGTSGCKLTTSLTNQSNTFAQIAARTCCSSEWVRNFSDDNGGGHLWGPEKMQTIDKSAFECVNWAQCGTTDKCFSCEDLEDPADPACKIRSTSEAEAEYYFKFMNSLEMLGVPQITVKSTEFSEITCHVRPYDEDQTGHTAGTVNDFMKKFLVTGEFKEFSDGTKKLYSAVDPDNFKDEMKQIFSETSISCCIPAGDEISIADDAETMCCTGYAVATDSASMKRCALRDYTNVSLYMNKFISSAAAGLNDSYFDPDTGFLKSLAITEQVACEKQVCGSNVLMRGVSLSNLSVPGHLVNYYVRRFIDSDIDESNIQGVREFFDAGARWNNNLYCVPKGVADMVASGGANDVGNLNVVSCD